MKFALPILLPVLLLINPMHRTVTAQSFTRVEAQTGVGTTHFGNGVAIADYDNDGFLDIFFTSYPSFEREVDSTWNKLLRGNGDGTFEDVTVAAGFTEQFINNGIPAGSGEKMGASWGDFDNDGDPDLFLANSRLDQLYRNEGNGTFTDITAEAGVEGCFGCYSSSGLWFDHDRDGDLDLYVSVLNGDNIMYLNNGDGTFRDITAAMRLEGDGITWTTVALDIGKDGFLDLYCANDTQINEFFENRSGQHYDQAARAYRVADEGAGMGLAIGDYNNDGLFDIYVTNIFNHQSNPLFSNLGNRRFENVAEAMGVDNSGWGWGTHFFDFDHDGDEDLAAVNGVVPKQYIDNQEQIDVQNFFFKNMLMENGQPGFINWSEQSNTNGDRKARGLEVLDYDGDGDLDMIVANVESSPYFFRNDLIGENQPSDKNWLKIKLEGTTSNRNAFGTEVKVIAGSQSFYRWHHGAGFYCQSIKPVHFGLGEATMVDEIQVTWLSGLVETFADLSSNQTIKIKEGTGVVTNTDTRHSKSFKVSAFPNPFGEEVNLRFDLIEPGDLTLQVYTAAGQEVTSIQRKRLAPGPLNINLQSKKLPDGLYLYVARFNDAVISGKIVRQN